jgi:enoyl-CoA hydratase/carnithine racemase
VGVAAEDQDMSRDQNIIIEERGPVDWVTLNRPDSLNALSRQMVRELGAYFQGLYTRPERRIVVLKAAGRAFCSGLDIKESPGVPEGMSINESLASQVAIRDIIRAMRQCPQPIIALVQGAACGGGFSLALAADFRIGGESMKMNAAYIRIGLGGCDIGSSYFLPRLVGVSVASELLLTGRFIHAERALRVNLVSEVVADDQLELAALPYIEDMLLATPLSLRMTKQALNMAVDASSLESVLVLEDRQQVLLGQTGDHREAVRAFAEKRRPVFTDG